MFGRKRQDVREPARELFFFQHNGKVLFVTPKMCRPRTWVLEVVAF